MRLLRRLLPRGAGLVLCAALPILGAGGPADAKPKFTAFDPPGTSDTYAEGINSADTITGHFFNQVMPVRGSDGYVRTSDGTITVFTAQPVTNTWPTCINDDGSIGGYWLDNTGTYEGFVRAPDGTVKIVDPPQDIGGGAYVYGINDKGRLTGYYVADGLPHGFVRSAGGTYTTFDAPGGTSGTYAYAINAKGTIAGFYAGSTFVNHGFVRAANGTITPFDAAGDTVGTFAIAISAKGSVTGYYVDGNNVPHGFVRVSNGGLTPFDAAGGTGGTVALAINAKGSITGYYIDGNGVAHGFVRARNGTIKSFDDPNAGSVSNEHQGTFATGINANGAIAGYYVDSSGLAHGFLRSL